MKRPKLGICYRVTCSSVVLFLLGLGIPGYAQQEEHKQDRPSGQEKQAEPPRQEQHQDKGRQDQRQEQEQAKSRQDQHQQEQQQAKGRQDQQQAKVQPKQQAKVQEKQQVKIQQEQHQRKQTQAKVRQEQRQQPQDKDQIKQHVKVQVRQQPATGLQKQQQAARPSQTVQHVAQAQQQNVWREHRAHSWQTEHRDWGQRGGYDGFRIPVPHFRGYFGPRHGFRIYSVSMEIFGGYPRFQYGGYWFGMLDPWPEYWSEDWYENDDVYIDYSGDGYYMYNRRYPRDRIAVTVYLN